jgi:hypothetical protein
LIERGELVNASPFSIRGTVVMAAALMMLTTAGCSRSAPEDPVVAAPKNPEQAATQVSVAFEQAAPEVKQMATVAAEFMRQADYEKAVISLGAIKESQGLTLQQGMAVHNSMVALEASLIQAIEAGDPNAKRAYELLKAHKRN